MMQLDKSRARESTGTDSNEEGCTLAGPARRRRWSNHVMTGRSMYGMAHRPEQRTAHLLMHARRSTLFLQAQSHSRLAPGSKAKHPIHFDLAAAGQTTVRHIRQCTLYTACRVPRLYSHPFLRYSRSPNAGLPSRPGLPPAAGDPTHAKA